MAAQTGEHVVIHTKAGDQRVFAATDMRVARNTWPLVVLSPWFYLLGTLVFLRATPTIARVTYALFASAAMALAMAPASIEDKWWAVAGEFVVVPLFAGCFLLFFLVFPVVAVRLLCGRWCWYYPSLMAV